MPTISPKLAESLTRYFENELVKKDKNIKSLRARSGHRTDDLQQRIRSLQKKIDSMNRSSNLDRPGMAGLIRLVSTKRRLLAVLEKIDPPAWRLLSRADRQDARRTIAKRASSSRPRLSAVKRRKMPARRAKG